MHGELLPGTNCAASAVFEMAPSISVPYYGHMCKCIRLFRATFGILEIAFHSIL